ncbi:hypothetical protein [Pontibacter akesuensis]|uniref:hypothetical protein n=1 Tax=Pontibacter akesuensis TaxID=388950 RepID=UPI001113805C|nr:hypothetical protein [Pontibacter akesuensis]
MYESSNKTSCYTYRRKYKKRAAQFFLQNGPALISTLTGTIISSALLSGTEAGATTGKVPPVLLSAEIQTDRALKKAAPPLNLEAALQSIF